MDIITHSMTVDGVELDCELEFVPGQTATETDPAFRAEAYLITAKVKGVDIRELLDPRVVIAIEDAAALATHE
jgi:hypothetical protein